jgi:hypothetical protein
VGKFTPKTLGGLGILILALQIVNAQNSTAVNLKTYENIPQAFTINYPSDWELKEADPDRTPKLESMPDVELLSPDDGKGYCALRAVDVDPRYLDTDTMTLKNYTIASYAAKEKISDAVAGPYKAIRDNEFPVSGEPGWKLEYMLGNLYHLKVITIANDKKYTLDCAASSLDAPGLYPIYNKLVDSFQLIDR